MSSNKIAKNSIFLYVRMFFIMGVTLYSVRLLLRELGIIDYGIFNTVAGVVYSLNFLNAVMISATQRYFSFYIGKKEEQSQNYVFNASMLLYIIISIIILLLGETIGLWFVNNMLVIPPDRIYATNIIYQLTIFSFIFSMLSIPYRSYVIAQEKMNIFALYSIIEVVLKLFFVLIMCFITIDKLIYYGIVLLSIQILLLILYRISCNNYSVCAFRLCKEREVYKSIISFSGWTMYGTIANVGIVQGNTILINLFFGAIVNASRAISQQIGTALSTFSYSFITAVKPPMIKAYAEGNYKQLEKLYYFSNKFVYYLLLIILIPLFIKMEYILKLWLGDVNTEMLIFSKLTLIYTFIMSLNSPITIIMQATGKIRKYFSIVETFTLLSMPLTYLLFKSGCPAESTYFVTITLFLIAHIFRLIILQKTLAIFKISKYIKEFILKAILITISSSFLSIYVEKLSNNDFVDLVSIVFISSFSVFILVYFFCLSVEEKKYILKVINRKKPYHRY